MVRDQEYWVHTRPGCNDTTQVPERVIERRHLAAMLGVCHFRDEKGTCAVGNVRSRAHDKAADEVHSVPSRPEWKRLQQRAQDDEDAADGCAPFSAEAVGDVGREEKDEEAAKAWHSTEDSESTS